MRCERGCRIPQKRYVKGLAIFSKISYAMTMKRTVVSQTTFLYVRVSTEDQARGVSLAAQEERLLPDVITCKSSWTAAPTPRR